MDQDVDQNVDQDVDQDVNTVCPKSIADFWDKLKVRTRSE